MWLTYDIICILHCMEGTCCHILIWRAVLTAFEVSNLKVPTKHLNTWRRQAPSGIDLLTCAICSCQWWLWPHAWKKLCCTKSCDGRGTTMLHVKSWRSSRTNSRFWSDNFLQPRHLHPKRSWLHHSAMFGVTVVHDCSHRNWNLIGHNEAGRV